MASTAHKTEKEKIEHFDSSDVLDKKIHKLAEMIKKSKHFTIFTGAGISTSTGIPDFRSGKDTCLVTGPGAWEKQAQGIQNGKKYKHVSCLQAIPSKTHMAIVELEKKGHLKYLISQNCDGLHRRSGFPPEKFAELHGNTNMEKCQKCRKAYMRDFGTRTAYHVNDHRTGRYCENQQCQGELHDTIINFGENLPEREITEGFENSEKSDLCLVLGSSLRVTPAANMPKIVGKNQQLVIVNLQETPLDGYAKFRINGLCDKVMEILMEKLKIQIPKFSLQRRVKFTKKEDKLDIQGIDSDEAPYSFFKSITCCYGRNQAVYQQKKIPYNFPIMKQEVKKQIQVQQDAKQQKKTQFENNMTLQDLDMQINIEFYGHYGEESYSFNLNLESMQEDKQQVFMIEFDPLLGKWFQQTKLK